MGKHEILKPTAIEMNEIITAPRTVSPEGLRVRAKLVRETLGDESCARHLELAADEIAKLRRKMGKSDDPELEASGYATATEKTTKEMRLTLTRSGSVLGWLVYPVESVYDFGTHVLHLYDELEGIE